MGIADVYRNYDEALRGRKSKPVEPEPVAVEAADEAPVDTAEGDTYEVDTSEDAPAPRRRSRKRVSSDDDE